MSSPSKAVFLSYASEDSEAALRICESLRARGVEVWFDQSELRGGDAWDQKIRKQIRECALFMPLISANTNARAEGYFRLEWRLAVDRSLLMADDAPFVLPVVIDETAEPTARVPDRFRDVQWMRLGGKDTPESIASQVLQLLDGAPASRRTVEPNRKPRAEASRGLPRYFWPVAGVVIALVVITKPGWQHKRKAESVTAPSAATPVSDATQLARRAIGLTVKLNFTREDLEVAADIARRSSELDSSLALAWGARSRVETSWMQRRWDLGQERRRTAQEFAARALALDPEEPNALFSQGIVLVHQRAWPEAVALLKRAAKGAPEDNYIRRTLAAAYGQQGRTEDAIAALEEALRLNPRDVLAYSALATVHASPHYLKDGNPANVDVALGYIDRALELQVFGTALVQKAVLQASWKGDVAGAQATLDRLAALPLREVAEDRVAYYQMWIALLDREPARALAAAARTTSTYFEDAQVASPVAWMKAFAHKQAGRASAAGEEWRAAESLLRARLAASPESLPTQAELAITLAMLGRRDEAAKQFARYDSTQREQGRQGTLSHVRFHTAMGDVRRAVAAITEARKSPSVWVTEAVLARDPWFDGLRTDAEFNALTKAHPARK